MKNIKPCPFCGDILSLHSVFVLSLSHCGWYILCDSCGAQGPKKLNKQKAIDLWNDRSTHLDKVQAIKSYDKNGRRIVDCLEGGKCEWRNTSYNPDLFCRKCSNRYPEE